MLLPYNFEIAFFVRRTVVAIPGIPGPARGQQRAAAAAAAKALRRSNSSSKSSSGATTAAHTATPAAAGKRKQMKNKLPGTIIPVYVVYQTQLQ